MTKATSPPPSICGPQVYITTDIAEPVTPISSCPYLKRGKQSIPIYPHQPSRNTTNTTTTTAMPLQACTIPPHWADVTCRTERLYIVGFKASHTNLFHPAKSINLVKLANDHAVRKNNLVIVKADLGKVVRNHVLIKQVINFQTQQQELLQALPTNSIPPLWAQLLESSTMPLSLQLLSPKSH
ncbi:hypothetical protein PTTG_26013 [Puccinia triticina 1-1 BBBD Race 1]|uniref:Uncharacterized protein n=1 Tax=Puccinia triticina (isolate 1-1 / race 1 (BBBD)) TaxID=630390 RepID=A0A180GXQ0_PUCT1|nr:hypothetical protein PTTG_26013 [Puccinia triticina 1-1 BBBD Race 1]